MIDKIDYKIKILLKQRDSPSVIKSPELRLPLSSKDMVGLDKLASRSEEIKAWEDTA